MHGKFACRPGSWSGLRTLRDSCGLSELLRGDVNGMLEVMAELNLI